MIDVPYEVKRALKDGNRPKNYRVLVYGSLMVNVWKFWSNGVDETGPYTATADGEYMFFDASPIPNPEEPIGMLNIGYYRIERGGQTIATGAVKRGEKVTLAAGDELHVGFGELWEDPGTIYLWHRGVDVIATETVGMTIDNNNIVKESVKIDERMCSGDRLKFGLCEGASLEFQYFNFPNIRGMRIQVFLDVPYESGGLTLTYSIPMGFYTVDQCSTQFSTGIVKAVCYNKLRSDFLDKKANTITSESLGSIDTLDIASLLRLMLADYRIEVNYGEVEPVSPSYPGDPFPIIDQYTTCTGTKDLYMKQYGVNAPLNYYEYGAGAWQFATVSYVQIFKSDDGPCFLDFKQGSFVAFERAVYELLRDSLDKAEFIDANNNPITGQQILDDICRNANFAKIVGIASDDRRYFSTIQWEFEEKNNLTHKVAGNANDALVSLDSAEVIFPYSYGLVNSSQPLIVFSREVSFNGEDLGSYHVYMAYKDYRYYLDANQTLSYTEYAPVLMLDEWKYTMNVSDLWAAYLKADSGMGTLQVTLADLPDFTLREIQSAVYETLAQYGQLDRTTDLFYGVELNSGSLLPQTTLYPSDTLFPNQGYGNNIFHPFPSEYQKLWTDSVGEQTFRYLIITYKAVEYDQQGNPTEVEKTLQRTVHEHGTTNYNCSDNWLFRNLVWTAEQVGAYADAMVAKMQNIRWFPYEMWCAGLPYIEVGDAIEITDKQGNTHISYVLQRQLNGVQNLQDTYINGELDIF